MKNLKEKKQQAEFIELFCNEERKGQSLKYIKKFIKEGVPDKAEGALISLSKAYMYRFLHNNFKEDVVGYDKSHAYLSGFISRICSQINIFGYDGFNDKELLYPVLSNHKELIHWYSQSFAGAVKHVKGNNQGATNPSSYAYLNIQQCLALQQDWENLAQRSAAYLANPPKKRVLERIDHRFYLALAEGQVGEMQDAIQELLSPKVMRHRLEGETWVSESDFFYGAAVLLCKLASLAGYELDVDSPWVPMHWMDNEPLKPYQAPPPQSLWSRLKDGKTSTNVEGHYPALPEPLADWESDLFKPLPDLESRSNAAKFSPRPPDQPILTFDEAMSYA